MIFSGKGQKNGEGIGVLHHEMGLVMPLTERSFL